MTEGTDTPQILGGGERAARAVGYLLAFIAAQIVSGVTIGVVGSIALGPSRFAEAAGDLVSVPGVLILLVVEVFVAIVALGLVVAGPGFAAMGLGVAPAQDVRAALAIAPVTALIILPILVARGDKPLVDPSLSSNLIGLLILFSISVGLAEELFFRGLILDALGGARRPWGAAIGSSALFGLPHVIPNGTADFGATLLNAVGVAIVVGIPFALVRLRSGALLPLVVAHALIDTAAFLHTASITAIGTPSREEVVVTLVGASLVAGAYAVWFWRTEPARPRWVYH